MLLLVYNSSSNSGGGCISSSSSTFVVVASDCGGMTVVLGVLATAEVHVVYVAANVLWFFFHITVYMPILHMPYLHICR